MRPLEAIVSDLIAEAQHGADSLDFREVLKYQAVIEAATAARVAIRAVLTADVCERDYEALEALEDALDALRKK